MAGVIISLFLQIRKLKVGEIRDLGKVSGELSLGGTQDNWPQNSSSDWKPKATENANEREKAVCVL